jgi:aminomethyltransferase
MLSRAAAPARAWSRRSGARQRAFASDTLKRTALYDFHVKSKGTMVDFAGWALPALYGGEQLIPAVQRCRTKSAVFDVSHMGQLRITCPKRIQFLESIVVGAIGDLPATKGQLSLMTNENGGIIDDTVITNYEDHVYMVINAGCADKDLAWIFDRLAGFNAKEGGDACHVQVMTQDRSLLAVQGPEAEKHLQPICDIDLSKLSFMEGRETTLGGKPAYVTRCGYTGEDGFEVSVAYGFGTELAERLLGEGSAMAGLGARDALRLEAGLCLYGNDIDEETTPVEAKLMWTIQKRRRQDGGFPGHEKIMAQFTGKTATRGRVGLLCSGAPARKGAEVRAGGKTIGVVTSGSHSPILGRPVAMAYLPNNVKDLGPLETFVRNKGYAAELSKMPFVPTKYKSA